jgi:hypothetical protein
LPPDALQGNLIPGQERVRAIESASTAYRLIFNDSLATSYGHSFDGIVFRFFFASLAGKI